jgi:hypothetical protein
MKNCRLRSSQGQLAMGCWRARRRPRSQAQRDRLAGQEAQAVAARRLQVQQQRVGRQRTQGPHGGDDLLRGMSAGPPASSVSSVSSLLAAVCAQAST